MGLVFVVFACMIYFILYMIDGCKNYSRDSKLKENQNRAMNNRIRALKELYDQKVKVDIVSGYYTPGKEYSDKLNEALGKEWSWLRVGSNKTLHTTLCMMEFGMVDSEVFTSSIFGFACTHNDYYGKTNFIKENKFIEKVVKYIYDEMDLYKYGRLCWRDKSGGHVYDISEETMPYSREGYFYISGFAEFDDYLPNSKN